MLQDARKSPRYAVEATVELTTDEATAKGRTRDISLGGLCAIVDRIIGRGQVARVKITLVFDEETFSEPLELPARVVWSTSLSDSEHQLGTQFLKLDDDQKAFLEMFLRYLEEGLAAAEEEEEDEDTEDPFAS